MTLHSVMGVERISQGWASSNTPRVGRCPSSTFASIRDYGNRICGLSTSILV